MAHSKYEPTLKFYQQAGAFLGAFHQPLTEKLESFFESQDAAPGADGTFAQVASGVHPQEARITDFLERAPYNNPDQVKDKIREAGERGWVTVSETGFTATAKALEFTDRLFAILKEYTAEMAADLSIDIPRLVELLGHVVAGAESAPFDFKPTFTAARNYEYEDKTPSLLWVRRHLISLGSYRDDCHLEAWRQHDLPGYVWETLSFIWQGEANTAAELVEKLPYRDYQDEDYARALEKLVKLGWAEKVDQGYALTGKGRSIREQAEDKTDENYMATFAVLSDQDLVEMIALLESLTAAITPETEEGPQPD